MHRTDAPGNVSNLYTEGDPEIAQPATTVSADAMNAIQEEICQVIEGASLTLSKPDNTQLFAAIKRISGRAARSVAFADSPVTLGVADGGLVVVNAAAGNVVINMPAASALAALDILFVRTDNSANTVTINRVGSDTIDAATSVLLATKRVLRLVADGALAWLSDNERKSGAGTQIGYARTATTASSNTTTAMPANTSTPTTSDGAQLTAVNTAYVAKFSDSLLEVEVTIPIVSFNALAEGRGAVALFRDSTCIAVAHTRFGGFSNVASFPLALRAVVSAADVSSHTFSVRFGPTSGGGMWVNEDQGSAGTSSVRPTTLTVKEIKQ